MRGEKVGVEGGLGDEDGGGVGGGVVGGMGQGVGIHTRLASSRLPSNATVVRLI